MILRVIAARPRLLISLLAGVLVIVGLPWVYPMHDITRYIAGWNSGVILYLMLVLKMIAASDTETILFRAKREFEGKKTVLTLVIVAAITCLLAIVAELATVKDMHGMMKAAHISLSVVTLLSSWALVHVMFALYYAHDFYSDVVHQRVPGLIFPGEESPGYSDFLYFAFIIGTSGQTADVSFSSRKTRKLGSLHCVLSFFFNATVLALMINIAAGLI